ncbi:MAG TPA: ABC transporter ATP-binding protein [Clostridiales bacterium]|nr:ABC transporter ATP-binding protein [Clostridiales bacterium]
MKNMLSYLRDYLKESVLAPLFKMLEASFDLLVPVIMASIINFGIVNRNTNYILRQCAILLLLGVVGLVCSITAQYFASKAAVGYATGLRSALFKHIQTLGFSEMDTIGTSTLITRMTSDINQVQNGFNLFLRLFLRSPFIILGSLVMAFRINRDAALIFVVVVPVLCVAVFGIMLYTMPLYKKVQQGLDRILGITRENLTGTRVIRAFGREEHETSRFEAVDALLCRLQRRVGAISSFMNPITYIIINIAILAILYTGAVKVNTGSLMQGDVIALISYMGQILIELVKLANLIIQMTKAAACAGRVRTVFQLRSAMEFPDLKASQPSPGSAPPWNSPGLRPHSPSPDSGEAVRFEQVSLTYAKAGEKSLADISFQADRGQVIGIIGGTGSGKSSLVNLIPRFYDATEGTVKIFGRPIREYPRDELRNRIGVVMQKAQLFQGTIRSNLLWGNEDATEEALWQALATAQAESFVREKQQGLNHPVEQGGRNLSGGQKQRLTIARALIKNPDILILDDSTSALDFATDAALRKALTSLMGQMTIFIVSQRASSIRHADRILVLEDGRLAGSGTHEELLKTCEVYQEIHESQYRKGGE